MKENSFVSADDIRSAFSAAMSVMYREEVPAYGTLMELVAKVNDDTLAADPLLKERLDATDSLDRISEERHGAIRLGTPAATTRGFGDAPRDRDLAKVADMVREVKALGLETCATLGMLSREQAETLKQAGLDYYNHNLDTSPEYYSEIISTRCYQDRLDTLAHVRDAGMKTCCGGIVGMGESRRQRAGLLQTLANLPAHPDSVPINRLVQVEGTPLHGTVELDPFEFVRTIAVARILMPKSMVRLSAGRETMSDELQALCFSAGANSIFYGEKLLTTGNPDTERDMALFARLGLRPMQVESARDDAIDACTTTVHAGITEAA